MKIKTVLIFISVALVLTISTVAFAINNGAISHPDKSIIYNEKPTPTYIKNNEKDVKDFVPKEKCLEKIAKNKTSKTKSVQLKTWGKHASDDTYDDGVVNYQVDENRMVYEITTYFPDGLDTKAGFYNNATLVSVFDAETGNVLKSQVIGDYTKKK
jgi:hypothetical protein